MSMFDFLPPNVTTHFKPTGAFLDWFVGHVAGRFTLEVGAGQCQFAMALAQLGVKILAIEPRPSRETQQACINFLLPMAAERVTLLKEPDKVIVAARPDHSGWFNELAELVHPESELIYIGLAKNFNTDISRHLLVDPLYRDAGEDGEVVLRITRPQDA